MDPVRAEKSSPSLSGAGALSLRSVSRVLASSSVMAMALWWSEEMTKSAGGSTICSKHCVHGKVFLGEKDSGVRVLLSSCRCFNKGGSAEGCCFDLEITFDKTR